MRTPQSQMFKNTAVGRLRKLSRVEERFHEPTSSPLDRDCDLFRGDRLLAINEEPPLGAHLVTPRFAYAHHGVYVGGGAVVHYAAFAKHWRRGPVEETSLLRFAQGHAVWIRPGRSNRLQSAEIVRRARSRLGEDCYSFFTNNCEHLSEWCVNGEHRSPQVESLLIRLRRVSRALSELRRFMEVAPRRRSDSLRPVH